MAGCHHYHQTRLVRVFYCQDRYALKDIKTGFEDFLDPITPGLPTHQDLNLAIMHLSLRAGKRDTIIERIHLAVNQHSSKLDSLLAWKASMRAIAGQ